MGGLEVKGGEKGDGDWQTNWEDDMKQAGRFEVEGRVTYDEIQH